MQTGRRAGRPGGYTYLLVLFMVAALGLFAAQAGVVWQLAAQREREAELLAIGVEMARALARYAGETPTGTPIWPTELEELVEDRRFPVPRRHLRRIYRDPFTGRADWGVVRERGKRGQTTISDHNFKTAGRITGQITIADTVAGDAAACQHCSHCVRLFQGHAAPARRRAERTAPKGSATWTTG